LLNTSQSLSLTINEKNKRAIEFYKKSGFELHSDYETIYLR